ncbi:MAG TPA: sodium:solute symporter family protein [Planctomycetota bacterium]|nr:sodium:solute symporter family protein [Planctomycetota bacterium]
MLALAAVAAYLAVLLAVGWVKSAQAKGQASFALANRKLGLFVLLGTLLATWTGTGSIFGQAEKAYADGLPTLILPLGPVLGFLALIVLCTRVRRHGAYTLQDLLEARFGPAARVIGTATLLLAYLVIVSYQFRAAATVLERVLEHAGLAEAGSGAARASTVVIVALVVAAYTALAGMLSVALTDTLTGVLLTVGLLVALPWVWAAAGGTDAVLASLPAHARTLAPPVSAFELLSLTLPTLLLVLGDANLHSRFLSARSDATARAAATLLIPAVLLIDGAIILLAVGGRVLLPDLAQGGHIVLELALRSLPPALGALLAATILAIIVSTADSYLLTSATALVRDVYQRFLRPGANDVELLRTARLLVFACAGVALAMSFASDRYFRVAFFAYTIYGVGITPPLLAALFWKRATPAGAVSSMLAATTTAIVWQVLGLSEPAARVLGQPPGSVVEAVVPAALVAAIVLIGVSWLGSPRAPSLAPSAPDPR